MKDFAAKMRTQILDLIKEVAGGVHCLVFSVVPFDVFQHVEESCRVSLLTVLVQVRSDLAKNQRAKINTQIIIDVHARDIVDRFIRDSIMDAREASSLSFCPPSFFCGRFWGKLLSSTRNVVVLNPYFRRSC